MLNKMKLCISNQILHVVVTWYIDSVSTLYGGIGMNYKDIIVVVLLTTLACFMGMDTTNEFLLYLAIGLILLKYEGKENKA